MKCEYVTGKSKTHQGCLEQATLSDYTQLAAKKEVRGASAIATKLFFAEEQVQSYKAGENCIRVFVVLVRESAALSK